MFQIDMAKKKPAPKKSKPAKKGELGRRLKARRARIADAASAAPVKRSVDMTEMAGEAYTIHEPGIVRRKHTHESSPQALTIEQKLMIVDNLLSKFTHGMSCEDLDILGMHVTAWAAEIVAVRREDVPDDKIQAAKVIFPTEPVLRLLDEVHSFTQRHQMPDESAVDFLVMKMHGDPTKQASQLN